MGSSLFTIYLSWGGGGPHPGQIASLAHSETNNHKLLRVVNERNLHVTVLTAAPPFRLQR